MKDILAENMRRFNTKNLCEQVLQTINPNVLYRTQYDHFGVKKNAKTGDATAFILIPKGTEFKVLENTGYGDNNMADNPNRAVYARHKQLDGPFARIRWFGSWSGNPPDSIKKMNPTDILNPSKQGLFAPYLSLYSEADCRWQWTSPNGDELRMWPDWRRTDAFWDYRIGTNLTTALINAFKVK
jgi:hypothetical protein